MSAKKQIEAVMKRKLPPSAYEAWVNQRQQQDWTFTLEQCTDDGEVNASSVLMTSMSWRGTKEGHEYWSELHNDIAKN